MTLMTMNCRGSLKAVRHLSRDEPGSAMGRQRGERKAVKERCRCEAQSAYLFPHISPLLA
jgi:hypothetical protein